MSTEELAPRTVVVTGGASGIGEATVRRFATTGANVVIADIDEQRGATLAAELGARFLRCDVTIDADMQQSVAVALQAFGRLDVYVNNAGVPGPARSIMELEADDFDRGMAILLRGPMLGMRYAAIPMVEQGAGSIVNVASAAGIRPGIGPHIYVAAKAGLIQLTASVSAELGRSGVRVNAVSPGFIPTNIGHDTDAGAATDNISPLFDKVFRPAQHLPRVGDAVDVANAIHWLGGDESSFVTGHTLTVDGGFVSGRAVPSLMGIRPAR